ncbi:MAG: hypothetical protein IJO76_03610 [Clostridia bacterium]|nr:hypothetical protein [Clostridia bacterium]
MITCTFFGHRDTPDAVEPILHSTLIDLIENHQITIFYVGNNGNFDNLAIKELKMLKNNYPHIHYTVVLAYLPNNSSQALGDTVYPEGLETVPQKYAISRRNNWMINKADFVITYVTRSGGGADQFKAIAEKKKKTVINLSLRQLR